MAINYQTDIPSIFHNFTASKLVEYEAIWLGSAFQEHPDGQDDDEKSRLAAFCYMIPGGECFDRLRFDHADNKTLQAERYGGIGTGNNGGGVRCGNIGKYQVKGIGKNPLVGLTPELWHSYGGLNAEDAVYEAIYSNILEKILPVGVVTVHAVVATGPNAAYTVNTGERGWGALMVRDTALRPGHFIRAAKFAPARQQAATMVSDVGRVRAANKQLLAHFESVNDFIRFLGNFLMKCANQFAFARVARLIHGSLSSSNMCFDGRWIDLTNTSFLPSGSNTVGFTSFYEECNGPIAFLSENLDTFNKYNGSNLRIEPLAKYYFTQLNAYFKHHLGYLFAIEYNSLPESAAQNELEYLKGEVLALLSSGTLVRDAWPETLPTNDPVLAMLEYAYCSVFNLSLRWREDQCFQFADAEKFSAAFRSTFNCVAERARYGIKRFAIASFITAYKRSAFPAYFYKARLSNNIKEAFASSDLGRVKELVCNSVELSSWVFSPSEEDCVVAFRSPALQVKYCERTGAFVMTDGEFSSRALSTEELQNLLAEEAGRGFEIEGFDFGVPLARMLDAVAAIELEPED